MTDRAARVLDLQPDDILRVQAARVEAFDADLGALLDRMASTMRECRGVGLAAPQIGVGLRVAVVDIGESDDLLELVNPHVEQHGLRLRCLEGCLSLPGYAASVLRSRTVFVMWTDRTGRRRSRQFHDEYAQRIQHEVDHLNGTLVDGIRYRTGVVV